MSVEEEINPADAVARQILQPKEVGLVSSVTKVGAGGFGNVYKMGLVRYVTDQGIEEPHWMSETLVSFFSWWNYR